MADIFVSYARADKARVAPLVAALEAQGWSVWWDPAITPGQEFDRQISAELDVAKAVIVVWTPTSVESRWVRGEARDAADRGIIVPVRFEKARLPIDARSLHTTDLDDWNEDVKGRQFQDLLQALSLLLKDVPRKTPDAERRVSICVLPFANMSDDREQEYFSDGISEDIITDLSKVSALAVVARNTAFTFKGKSVDVAQVAQQLKVSHVLEGSVRKSGNRVRITAQLIDGGSGNHVWAERYDRDLSEIFALQDEISEAIVGALKLKLLPEEKAAIEDRGTKDIEAYDLYLRGVSTYDQMGYENVARAAELLRKALARDPAFSSARTSLVTALRIFRFMIGADRASVQQEIEDLIEDGILDAKDLAKAHYWRGLQKMEQRDWLAAERALERANALTPVPEVEVLSLQRELLHDVGRLSEALAFNREMTLKDPLSLARSTGLQLCLRALGKKAEAEAEYQRTLTLSGDRAPIEFQHWMGRAPTSTAAERLEGFRHIRASGIQIPADLSFLEGVLEQPEAARTVLRQAFTDRGDKQAMHVGRLAVWAGFFGDTDLALDCLHAAYLDLGYRVALVKWAPPLAEARKHPRFKQLIRDLGIYNYWKKSGKWGDFARPLGDDDFEIVR